MRNASVIEHFFQMILEAEQHYETKASEALPDMERDSGYRGIGGMYGGFKYQWDGDDKLIVYSSSRIIGGSEESAKIRAEKERKRAEARANRKKRQELQGGL